MEVHCIKCRRLVSRQFLENHQHGPKCAGDTTARVLLSEPYNLVPYPARHDLPDHVPQVKHQTRARYEGQRLDECGAVIPKGRSLPGWQVWVPAWVEIVVDAWRRLGLARKNRRDALLRALCAYHGTNPSWTFPTNKLHDAQVIELAQQLAKGTR